MRVSIPVDFIVTTQEGTELDESTAQTAAEQAVYDFLAFVEIGGYTSDSESVTVHVDGFGQCKVEIDN